MMGISKSDFNVSFLTFPNIWYDLFASWLDNFIMWKWPNVGVAWLCVGGKS